MFEDTVTIPVKQYQSMCELIETYDEIKKVMEEEIENLKDINTKSNTIIEMQKTLIDIKKQIGE
jgi:hypothetical protein|tara:strand:- start:26417 stop:26608 length:192 start_codon:yes stop_codon:yes gene_type:complete